MFYSTKRQQFLVDQSYSFKVITELQGMRDLPELIYRTRSEQIEVLSSVLILGDDAADVGTDLVGSEWADDIRFGGGGGARRGSDRNRDGALSTRFPRAARTVGSLSALRRTEHMSYIERNRSQNRTLARDRRHATFKKRDAARLRMAKEASAR